mgnify:FL=1
MIYNITKWSENPQNGLKTHENGVSGQRKYCEIRFFHFLQTERQVNRLFSGKAYHTVDAKGRLFIPAMYREELGSNFVVAKGFSDPYLVIYPQNEWEALISKIDALGMDKNARNIKRYVMMSANPTEMDAQGRIVLSKEHREFAGLSKDVTVLGMNNTIEIWDTAALEAETLTPPDNLEEILGMLK